MAAAFVVYINSDPANIVGLFFQQNFPAGKTAQEAAEDYSATLPASFPGTVRPATVDDYALVTNEDIDLP